MHKQNFTCFTYNVRINFMYVIFHTVLSFEKTEEKEMKGNLFSVFWGRSLQKNIRDRVDTLLKLYISTWDRRTFHCKVKNSNSSCFCGNDSPVDYIQEKIE